MKWWHWLILELLILFGVTTWIYFFPDEVEANFAKGVFGFALIYFIETFRNAANDEKEVPKKRTSEEKNKMFKTELDWVSAYKKLEEDNEDLKQSLDWANEREKENTERITALEEENKKLKKRFSHDCSSCDAFGKHCPHKVNGDSYFYDCYLTVKDLEEENTELKKQQFSLRNERNTLLAQNEQHEKDLIDFNENLTKAKEIMQNLLDVANFYSMHRDKSALMDITSIYKAEQFLNNEVEK